MSLGSHLEELRKKHETLSIEVEDALRKPYVDQFAVSEMKKQKLKLKEEIVRLRADA